MPSCREGSEAPLAVRAPAESQVPRGPVVLQALWDLLGQLSLCFLKLNSLIKERK